MSRLPDSASKRQNRTNYRVILDWLRWYWKWRNRHKSWISGWETPLFVFTPNPPLNQLGSVECLNLLTPTRYRNLSSVVRWLWSVLLSPLGKEWVFRRPILFKFYCIHYPQIAIFGVGIARGKFKLDVGWLAWGKSIAHSFRITNCFSWRFFQLEHIFSIGSKETRGMRGIDSEIPNRRGTE